MFDTEFAGQSIVTWRGSVVVVAGGLKQMVRNRDPTNVTFGKPSAPSAHVGAKTIRLEQTRTETPQKRSKKV